jgi:hypothetical protein
MSQAREPDDIDRVNRELRGMNRRLDRLEDTQISPQEFSSVLDRIYEEIGSTRSEMRAEFVAVNARLDLICWQRSLNLKLNSANVNEIKMGRF